MRALRRTPAPVVQETVELRGRRLRCYSLITWAVGLIGLAGLSLLDAALTGHSDDELRSWAFRAPLAGAVILVLLAVVRGVAMRAIVTGMVTPARTDAGNVPPDPGEVTGPDPLTGTIITCSGGGIKSASFCLGALQVLDSRPGGGLPSVYRSARAVVAVSGGGYIASAFAARYHTRRGSPQAEPVFAVGGSDEAVLRRNTNYLASTGRARYDLVSSLIFGFLINVMISIAVMCVIAWILIDHVRAVVLIDPPHPNNRWYFHSNANHPLWQLFIGPLILVVISLVAFLVSRFVPARFRHAVTGRFGQGRVAGVRILPLDQNETALASWMSNLPNTLMLLAILTTMFYPGVPWLAYLLHNLWVDNSWARWWKGLTIGGVIAGIGSFLATVRSATKGLPKSPTSPAGRVVGLFRQKVAPRAGVALAALGGYLGLIGVTVWFFAAADQPAFLRWITIVVTGGAGLVSANRTSMSPFYRARLDKAFLPQYTDADPLVSPLTINDLATRPPGDGPELVLCATANIKDSDLLPSLRNGSTFVFGDRIGLSDQSFPGATPPRPANEFHPGAGNGKNVELATAMAVSAAAISPLAGREDKALGAYRLLLALANIRLGVWMRNPCWSSYHRVNGRLGRLVTKIDRLLDIVMPFQVVREALGTPSIYSPYLYLTDGGHFDNLGLVEALRRRPRQIIMLDGSGDAEDQFPAMGDAIASARMDLSVDIEFDPEPLQRANPLVTTVDKKPYPATAWTTATAKWPSGDPPTEILYIKCVLPAGLSWDLNSYRLRHNDFPATSNKLEMYDEFDFEAYRQLGYQITQQAMNHFVGGKPLAYLR